jgi:hypothetical protein
MNFYSLVVIVVVAVLGFRDKTYREIIQKGLGFEVDFFYIIQEIEREREKS